jgi:hypothetical protein
VLKKLLFLLLLPVPALAETYSVTADGGFPCDSFSGTIRIEGDHLVGRLSSPSSAGFYFNDRLVDGHFNTAAMGMSGAVRIEGTAAHATMTVFASEADCQGNLFLTPVAPR